MKSDSFFKDTSIMFLASMLTNVFNLLYHLFMVRMLTPVDFGVLNALLSLLIITSVASGTLQAVTTKFLSAFKAKNQSGKISSFLKVFFKKISIIGLIIFSIIFILRKNIADFLNLKDTFLVIIAGMLMFLSTIMPFLLGALQGLQKFKHLGATLIINAGLRFLVGVALVLLGLRVCGALSGIVIAGIAVLILAGMFLKPYFYLKKQNAVNLETAFDITSVYKYFLPTLIALPSFGLLTNMDVILVKHFFSPQQAGFYSVAQMVGKIILFLPGAVNIVMFPKLSQQHTLKKDTKFILKKCLFTVGAISTLSGIFCIIFPAFVLKLLAGNVLPECLPLVMPFAISMAFFSMSSVLMYYHLSLHDWRFIYSFLFFMILQAILIYLFHNSLLEVLYVLTGVSICLFFANLYSINWSDKQ